jgi:hypothetical protein
MFNNVFVPYRVRQLTSARYNLSELVDDLDFSATCLLTLNRIHRHGSPAGHKHSIIIENTRPFVPRPVIDLIDAIMPAPSFLHRHRSTAFSFSINCLAIQKEPV